MSTHDMSRYRANSSGFTLIELMISLVLGLLISAAVMQVYIVSTRTATVQQSASEVQDSAIFSLQAIEDHIRLVNLGNPISNINDSTNHGGIVLKPLNLGTSNATDAKYLTVSADSAGWTGLSNTNVESDQLTIKYKNITSSSLYDCEGKEITSGSPDWVVERYFVRKDTGGKDTDLVLACDAGRFDESGNIIAGSSFGDNGEVIISAVDQFNVLLGTLADVASLSYMPASTYLQLTEKPSITSVKFAVIVRSDTPLIDDPESALPAAAKVNFTILVAEQKLKSYIFNKLCYRRSYESTIVLRSARVMSVTGLKSNVKS